MHGRSNPISAADPGPQDLLCLYQTCFMLCLSTVCLLWTRRKRSCLHVGEGDKNTPQAQFTTVNIEERQLNDFTKTDFIRNYFVQYKLKYTLKNVFNSPFSGVVTLFLFFGGFIII